MTSEGLTGSRIRERRMIKGLRQADLARRAGISASYLNLIEHNRRRIGGKLLLDIADALGVAPSMLTQGAEATLIASLREAAEALGDDRAETDRIEDFAGRFPGWAETLADAHRRISSLERTVETLSDRMAHDPQLAASLYEVLATAASIRSTADILADTPDMQDDLRHRFHTNMNADSQRLSDSAKTLVQFLDSDPDDAVASSPLEEMEAFLDGHGYSFPELETGDVDIVHFIDAADPPLSTDARHLAQDVLRHIVQDGRAMPAAEIRKFKTEHMLLDPLQLAHHFDQTVTHVLQRLASLPELGVGLVVCDRSGSLVFRKPIAGFSVPRFGAVCPLWPLFQAFASPGQCIASRVEQLGRDGAVFDTFTIAEPVGAARYNQMPLMRSTMLISAPGQFAMPDLSGDVEKIGPTCRICPRDSCVGRREPSILGARISGHG